MWALPSTGQPLELWMHAAAAKLKSNFGAFIFILSGSCCNKEEFLVTTVAAMINDEILQQALTQ